MTEGGSGGGEIVAGEGETGRRAIIKAITYRVIVAITLAAISRFYTGNLFETSAVSITYTIIATIVYYVHKRAWIKVNWGKAFHSKKKPSVTVLLFHSSFKSVFRNLLLFLLL